MWAKSVMYEDSVGVPVIMAGPGIGHGVCNTATSLTDVAATVEDVCGLERGVSGEPWQSRSLAALAEKEDPQRFVLSEYHDGGAPTGFYMIRHGDWKYVYYAGEFPPQLFNLANDPNESNDLAQSGEHEGLLGQLHDRLCSILDPDEQNRRAFADQAELLEAYGGAEKVLAMPSFNYTPVGS
jgi:choline-sulfatase